MKDTDYIILAIGVLIAIFVTRLIFSIPTIVRNLKAQTELLKLISKKVGATDDEAHNAGDTSGPISFS